jgi:MATE family multidrug resistance protein
MSGHASPTDLAAMSLANSIFSSVAFSLIGVVLALNPIFAQFFGADRLAELGQHYFQGLWLALGLAAVGDIALLFPGIWLDMSQAEPEVRRRAAQYLATLAFALPATLLFRTVYALATAVSRPKWLMGINLSGVVLKLPLNYIFVFGKWGFPEMGAPGCALATTFVMWLSCLVAFILVRRRVFHPRLAIRFSWPSPKVLGEQLRLGVPNGISYFIEVTSFTLMTIFVARLGAHATGGHQIAVNLTGLCYSVPLALAVATGTLAAQELGAGRPEAARRMIRRGLVLATLLALVLSSVILILRTTIVSWYTSDPGVAVVAVTLVGYLTAFHTADAIQTVAGFALRAYKRMVAPSVIYAVCLGALGLGGGYALAFWPLDGWGMRGASGLWLGATLSLWIATAALLFYLAHVARLPRAAASPAGNALDSI